MGDEIHAKKSCKDCKTNLLCKNKLNVLSWKKEDCINFYSTYEISNQGIRENPNCIIKNFTCKDCKDYESTRK